MNRIIIIIGIISFLFSCSPNSQVEEKDEATLQQDQKMEWWREARFGLFIHWGLYAEPAGEWKGERIAGISEWIMARAAIPVKEYEKLAENFNPEKYDAEAWVKLAKYAGMKYIVITSKHHDGFAMFQSKASKYNIVDATLFGRDPLKELADACKKYGIRLGFYYSQAQDWHEPGGTYFNIEDGKPHWDANLVREPLMNYINGKAVPQVKEILENYGGLDILWWDTPRGMTEEAAQALQDVADEYPDMLTNNRLYRPWPGDFTTPEQHVPPTGLDYDWEVCMTMNTSWGYKSYDENWKSGETLIRMLVDIASKGGNLLLNVGPTPEGLFPEPSIDRLKQIGLWMQQNSESIYGTTASPFFKLPWGRCTTKEVDGNTILYLHVFDWPKTGLLQVPGLKTRIKDIYLLSNPKQKFAWKFEDDDLFIHAPSIIFDPINTVVVIETKEKVKVTSNMPTLKEGSILLPADFADIHNPGYGTHAYLSGSGKKSIIQNWVDARVRLEWMFNSVEPGKYKIETLIKANEICKLNVTVGDKNVESEIQPTNNKFEIISLGEIEISETGNQSISLTPDRENWGEVELMYVELVK
ncbi:MAG: alpha-L-fucosidase [Bacteroidetes bacterium]|nr:alpha-L-fucosidase [Bacteroidota bacterium]